MLCGATFSDMSLLAKIVELEHEHFVPDFHDVGAFLV